VAAEREGIRVVVLAPGDSVFVQDVELKFRIGRELNALAIDARIVDIP